MPVASRAPLAYDTFRLSSRGSTRGTAYSMSAKIFRGNGRLYAAWLDFVSECMVRDFDLTSRRWGPVVHLGTGTDNHSGPALAMDASGFLYVAFGPHHGPFQFRRTVHPYSIDDWTQVTRFGDHATYPSLVADHQGTLHCTYRGGAMPRRLLYQSRGIDGLWSAPRELVHPGVDTGYTQFGNALTVAPDGILHLAFHIYDMHPAGGKAVGYLRSTDRGKTWQTAEGTTVDVPVTPSTNCFLEQGPDLDMRVGNITVDSEGSPWIPVFYYRPSPPTVKLWHWQGDRWVVRDLRHDLSRLAPGRIMGMQPTITFDRHGVLYVAAVVQTGTVAQWGGASSEVVLLVSHDHGVTFTLLPISRADPERPNWLPCIERSTGPYLLPGPPAILYTHGGPGRGVSGGPPTDIMIAIPRTP